MENHRLHRATAGEVPQVRFERDERAVLQLSVRTTGNASKIIVGHHTYYRD